MFGLALLVLVLWGIGGFLLHVGPWLGPLVLTLGSFAFGYWFCEWQDRRAARDQGT